MGGATQYPWLRVALPQRTPQGWELPLHLPPSQREELGDFRAPTGQEARGHGLESPSEGQP